MVNVRGHVRGHIRGKSTYKLKDGTIAVTKSWLLEHIKALRYGDKWYDERVIKNLKNNVFETSLYQPGIDDVEKGIWDGDFFISVPELSGSMRAVPKRQWANT